MQSIHATYAGSLNPFGDPLPSAATTRNPTPTSWSSAAVRPTWETTVGIGFCTDSALARTGSPTPPVSWWQGGAQIVPAPLFIGVRWTWVGTDGQIQLFNDQPGAVTILSATVLDPGADAVLALEDLTPEAPPGCPSCRSHQRAGTACARGRRRTELFRHREPRRGPDRERLDAAAVDPGNRVRRRSDLDNVARLYIETSTP